MTDVFDSPRRPPARPAANEPPRLVAVLDMGASAIRLVIAEIGPNRSIRTIEEASRGILLGRDTFSSGAIRSKTVDAALEALDDLRHIIDGYGVRSVRAVATSAVREAGNVDVFLDRINGRTGIAFEIINEAEESRLIYLAVKQGLAGHAAARAGSTLIAEVGGGSTSLMLLKSGRPSRSAVYALGAVRLQQRLDLRRLPHEAQLALLKRSIAHVVEEIRHDIPLGRVTHMVAIGGDVRFAASQIQQESAGDDEVREVERDEFLKFCSHIELLDDEQLVEKFRLPPLEAETLVTSLLVYRALLTETGARRLVISEASLRRGVLLDVAEPGGRLSAQDFEPQVLASAEALGQKYRFDRNHGRHVADLAVRLFDEFPAEHGLSQRERLLLQVAALLHDVGTYVSLRAHHKHSQYLLEASQIFGLSNEETLMVSNIARYHRGGFPQKTHVPYVALDRRDRLIVNKLAAILRIANALDAEHLQKVRRVRLRRQDATWVLEVEGTGDVTMEQLAATGRSDMFVETFGRTLHVRPTGVQA